jgi:hypothetical protein
MHLTVMIDGLNEKNPNREAWVFLFGGGPYVEQNMRRGR